MSAQFQRPKRIVVTVAVAGVPVQISATSLYVRSAIMQAHYLNATGIILLGDTSVNAAAANAHALAPGDNINLQGDSHHARNVQHDLSHIWVNSTVNGSKLIVTYMEDVL